MDGIIIASFISGAVIGAIASLIVLFLIRNSFRKLLDDYDFNSLNVDEMKSASVQLFKNEILHVFDDFMSNKLVNKLPVLNMFIDEKLIAEIRNVFHEEMELQLPVLLSSQIKLQSGHFKFAIAEMKKAVGKKIMKRFLLVVLICSIAGGLFNCLVLASFIK